MVLSDPEKRELYDARGEQGIKEGGVDSGGMADPMDIFQMFFGGGRSRGPRRGKDCVHQLSVTLEELYNGSVRKLGVTRKVICDQCQGKSAYLNLAISRSWWQSGCRCNLPDVSRNRHPDSRPPVERRIRSADTDYVQCMQGWKRDYWSKGLLQKVWRQESCPRNQGDWSPNRQRHDWWSNNQISWRRWSWTGLRARRSYHYPWWATA